MAYEALSWWHASAPLRAGVRDPLPGPRLAHGRNTSREKLWPRRSAACARSRGVSIAAKIRALGIGDQLLRGGGWILRTQCVQPKAGASSGRQSRQGKSQEPCSLSRRQEGNQVF